jgi:hypothetical protein
MADIYCAVLLNLALLITLTIDIYALVSTFNWRRSASMERLARIVTL